MQMNIVVATGERKKVSDKNILAFLLNPHHTLANWGNDLQVYCWTMIGSKKSWGWIRQLLAQPTRSQSIKPWQEWEIFFNKGRKLQYSKITRRGKSWWLIHPSDYLKWLHTGYSKIVTGLCIISERNIMPTCVFILISQFKHIAHAQGENSTTPDERFYTGLRQLYRINDYSSYTL